MINYSRRWCTRHVSKQQRCVSVAWKNCATETTVAKEPHNGTSLIFVRRSTAIEKRAASVPRDHDFSCGIWLTFLFRSTEVTVDRVRKFLFGCNHIFCHVGWRTVNYSDTRANYAWRFAEPAKFGAFQFVRFLNHSDASWVSGNTVTKTLLFFFFLERERERKSYLFRKSFWNCVLEGSLGSQCAWKYLWLCKSLLRWLDLFFFLSLFLFFKSKEIFLVHWVQEIFLRLFSSSSFSFLNWGKCLLFTEIKEFSKIYDRKRKRKIFELCLFKWDLNQNSNPFIETWTPIEWTKSSSLGVFR